MMTKRCSNCGEVKAYEMFNRDKYAKNGYTSQCKVCRNEYKKAYHEANKEKRNEANKAWRVANKEKIYEYKKAYYEANKEKIYEYKKAYYEANKEKNAAKSSRRRALQLKAIPKFLKKCEAERQRLKKIFKLREVISLVTGIEHHVDHMWPLSDGGPHWSGNLQIIPAKENLTKSYKVCKVTKKNIKDSLRIARKEYENSSNGH